MEEPNIFSGCEFCLQIERHYTLRNRIIYQSDHLTVWPSLGAIGEGHILVMPNEHRTGFLEFENEERDEFLGLLTTYRRSFQKKGLSVLIGEHGNQPLPNTTASVETDVFSPVCVAHAHIHMIALPMEFDDLVGMYHSELGAPSFECDDLHSLDGKFDTNEEYVLASNSYDKWLLWTSVPSVESQLVRRVAASALGVPERFNWREFPELEQVEQTSRELSALYQDHPSNNVSGWEKEQSKFDLGGGFAKN